MHVAFHGIKPPALDTPLIEFETDDGELVDLYNDCTLRATTFDADGLMFEFVASDGATIRLRFRGVRRLEVEQSLDWVIQGGRSDRPSAHSPGGLVATVRVQGRRSAVRVRCSGRS